MISTDDRNAFRLEEIKTQFRELDLKCTSDFEAHRLRVIEPMKKLKTDWNNVPLPLVETI